jgi:hypothetical protein
VLCKRVWYKVFVGRRAPRVSQQKLWFYLSAKRCSVGTYCKSSAFTGLFPWHPPRSTEFGEVGLVYPFVFHPVAHTFVANELSRSNRLINQRKLGGIHSEPRFQNKHEPQDSNLMERFHHEQ